ncbi:inositol-3-phosphate synthase [Brevibacillus brevis]|uniref:Inositol-3-phosphate synthase n=1 Tax=Brevibacillus brevis TaxID=1393 RepID=A0ABY9T0A8_BREBE|nr:inositol-3-phosphate synthase [Brevibacillus brevis]WNC12959.1 inositol-3-phosphate synthase [Brevibacillus brevis]
MERRAGVLFVGALGAVATTTIAGLLAVKKGLVPLRGVISSQPEFECLDLISIDQLVFGGWDIKRGGLAENTEQHGIVPKEVLDSVMDELEQIPIWPAPMANLSGHIRTVYQVDEEGAGFLLDALSRLQQQIVEFKLRNNLDRVIVINLSATEEDVKPVPAYEKLSLFEQALAENSAHIRPGMLYAYAALQEKAAYVNFTPSTTAEIPALQVLAAQQGVPIAGKDGRTGQTLYKHVLGNMFRQRGLKVIGWYSTNLLGNTDGAVLEDPGHAAAKISSKTTGLERVLGYDDFDHKVRIDYFPVRGDRKEAWDSIDFEGWLGERMSMKVNWQGIDSVLAAPLVVDLAVFMEQALRAGLSGAMTHLSLFFKSPYKADLYALDEQYQKLREFAKEWKVNAEGDR